MLEVQRIVRYPLRMQFSSVTVAAQLAASASMFGRLARPVCPKAARSEMPARKGIPQPSSQFFTMFLFLQLAC